MSDSKPIVLVIGAGSIGTRHLEVVHGMGYPAMACDTDPAAFARINEIVPDLPTFTNLSSALAQQPDIVIVATAPGLHADHTIAAFEAGAHVLCEKPMADTVAACDRMIDAAKQSGKVLHVGFVNRYNPCITKPKRLTEEGALGMPLFASAQGGSYLTLICSRSRHQATTYAALLLDYTHQLDYIPWILDSPVCRVYAVARNRGEFELKSDPNMITMILEHESGVVSEIHLDFVRHPQTMTLSVTGDRGYMLSDLMQSTVGIGRREDESFEERTLTFERNDLFREQFANFVAATRGEPARIVDGEEGRASMRIVEAVLRSLASRTPVQIA